jgi:hypothetical protein
VNLREIRPPAIAVRTGPASRDRPPKRVRYERGPDADPSLCGRKAMALCIGFRSTCHQWTSFRAGSAWRPDARGY